MAIEVKLGCLAPRSQGTGYVEAYDSAIRFAFNWDKNIWPNYDVVKLEYVMTTIILGEKIDDHQFFPKTIDLNRVNFKNFLEFMPIYDGSYLNVGKSTTSLHIIQNNFFNNEFIMVSVFFFVKKLVGKAGLVYR